VPNASLIADPVTNWTLSDRMRRIDLEVRVAYGSAPDRVIEILLTVARANERVLQLPEPAAQFALFGESSLDFVLEAWVARHEQHGAVRSELALTIYRTLEEAGIAIAIPRRDVRVRVRSNDDADDEPAQG